jgi:acyl-CoA thioester hydrolase
VTRTEKIIEHGRQLQPELRSVMHGFTWQLRVYYQDTDAGGIVYHARYLDFMERARMEWLRALGINLSGLAAERQRMFVACSVTIAFLRPARLDDMLTVHAVPEKIARTYIDLNQPIYRGSTHLTRAQVRIACVDAASLKPCALPSEFARMTARAGSQPEKRVAE